MKIIEQDLAESKNIRVMRQGSNVLSIHDDFGDVIDVDKKGAAELIKILQEWVDENG